MQPKHFETATIRLSEGLHQVLRKDSLLAVGVVENKIICLVPTFVRSLKLFLEEAIPNFDVVCAKINNIFKQKEQMLGFMEKKDVMNAGEHGSQQRTL